MTTAPVVSSPASALLAAARRGDAAAREELVTTHLDTVRAVCGSRLRSSHDVADATQETFARALSSLDQVRDPEALDAWLRAIAVRVCADHGRQHLRSVAVADPVGDAPCDEPGPSDRVVADEDAARLHATLATLGTRDRQALWLRDAIGLPVAHVAADLGVTEGSARVLLTRARQRLRLAYEGVAGVAAVGLLRLRGRFATLGGADLRVALAAQLTIVAVAVGVAVPRAAAPGAPLPDDAPAMRVSSPTVAARVVPAGSLRDAPAPAADTSSRDGGSTAATDRDPGTGAPAPVVEVVADEAAPPSRFGVAAEDGAGEAAGIELWGGPITGGSSEDDEEEEGLPLGPFVVAPGDLVGGE